MYMNDELESDFMLIVADKGRVGNAIYTWRHSTLEAAQKEALRVAEECIVEVFVTELISAYDPVVRHRTAKGKAACTKPV